jgi:hypothetical protein
MRRHASIIAGLLHRDAVQAMRKSWPVLTFQMFERGRKSKR